MFVAPCMNYFKAKHIMVAATLLNACSTLFFLYSSNYWYLLGSRIVQGIAYAFFITYQPVWINTFAPRRVVTRWISTAQSLSVIGIIIGYIVGSAAADAE